MLDLHLGRYCPHNPDTQVLIYKISNLPLHSMGPPRSSSLRDNSSLKAWFLWRRPGVKPQMGLSTGRATSTSWVISANRITSWTSRGCQKKTNLCPFRVMEPSNGTYQGFLVVVSLGVDTNNHPHFSLAIKVVFEQMGYFGVSVGNHLQEIISGYILSHQKPKKNNVQLKYFVLCLCHTSGFLAVFQCTFADSAKTDWCYLKDEINYIFNILFILNKYTEIVVFP